MYPNEQSLHMHYTPPSIGCTFASICTECSQPFDSGASLCAFGIGVCYTVGLFSFPSVCVCVCMLCVLLSDDTLHVYCVCLTIVIVHCNTVCVCYSRLLHMDSRCARTILSFARLTSLMTSTNWKWWLQNMSNSLQG